MKFLIHIACCVILALVIGCADQNKEVREVETPEVEQDSVLLDGYEEELFKVRSDIWEFLGIYKDMQKAGFTFDSNLLVPPSKLELYTTNNQKAYGFGAYCTYLSFAIANKQHHEAVNGLNAVLKLADELKILGALDQELLAEIIDSSRNTNIDVTKLLSDEINNAIDYLHSNEHVELASIIIIGGWVEGLYVSTSMMKQNKERRTKKIDVGVWGHNFRYQSVIKMLRVFKDSPDCKGLEKSLLSIRKPVWYVISKGRIDDKQIESVYKAVADIR